MFKILKYIFIGIIVLGFLGAVFGKEDGGSSSNSSTTTSTSSSSTNKQQAQATREYAEADVDVLLNDVKNNAAKANKNYNGKYVKIVNGSVFNIESSARYIQIEGSDPYTLIHITCKPKNDQVKNAMIELSKGQRVTVYGKITDVGEIMGYDLDMDKIE